MSAEWEDASVDDFYQMRVLPWLARNVEVDRDTLNKWASLAYFETVEQASNAVDVSGHGSELAEFNPRAVEQPWYGWDFDDIACLEGFVGFALCHVSWTELAADELPFVTFRHRAEPVDFDCYDRVSSGRAAEFVLRDLSDHERDGFAHLDVDFLEVDRLELFDHIPQDECDVPALPIVQPSLLARAKSLFGR